MAPSKKQKKKRAARPEDLARLRAVTQPEISPDGKRVAYVVTEADRKQDRHQASIWIASLDAARKPRRFTSEGHCTNPRWSPDGTTLAFLANRGKGSQIFLAPLDGGEPQQLTRGAASAADPRWSPDGTQIAFVRAVGERHGKSDDPVTRNAPRVIRDQCYKLDGFGLFDGRRRHVFAIDVQSGKERQLTRGDWHDTQPAWSPDGKQIAFVSDRRRQRGANQFRGDLWLVPAAGGRARKLTRSRGNVVAPAWSPDGRAIAFVGHEHASEIGRNDHLMLARVRGSQPPRSLSAHADLSVVGLPGGLLGSPLAWLPDGQAVLFLVGDRGAVGIWRAEPASGAAKKVVEGEFGTSAFSLSADGRRVAFAASWSSLLPEVHVASLSRGSAMRRVSDANAALSAELDLAPTRRMTYRARDGVEIEAFVLPPLRARKGRRGPLVCTIHGGPHAAHPTTYDLLHHQILAGAGYTVILPNPRGSTTYGEAFQRASVRDWGGADYTDILAGVDELVKRGVADPKQLYVGGYSYGGYMSSWIVGQTDRFRAAVVGAPVADLASSFGTDDIPEFSVGSFGGTPWTTDVYRERSPVTHLPNVRTPVLLLHWEGDLRCPVGQSEQLFVGLKELGAEVEFVRYPGGSHGGRTPSQSVDYAERLLAWYARHAPRNASRPAASAKQ